MVDPNNNKSDPSPTGRFVVLSEGEVAVKLGIVSWRAEENQCQVQAENADGLTKIQSALNATRQARLESGAPSVEIEGFRTAFSQHGMRIEELPPGDLQVSFEYDIRSGQVVGRSKPLHEFAAHDEDLARKIQTSISEAMQRPMSELTARLSSVTDAALAAQVIREAQQDGLLGFTPTQGLLDALQKVNLMAAMPEDRKLLRTAIFEVAHLLKDHLTVASEAEALMAENPDAYSSQDKADLETAVAIGLLEKGRKEAALAIWRRLLKQPEALTPASRAWIWRNIAKALDSSDKRKLEAAKQSADAFLEAGDKAEAGRSLMMLVDLLMKEAPQEAVTRLDEIVALTDREGMRNEQFRAAAFHARARRLLDLRNFDAAFQDAEKAVAQWRGLMGSEAQLVSSLHLAAIILTSNGKEQEAQKFSDEADQIAEHLHLGHFELANQVAVLLKNFDARRAEEIEQAARAADNLEILAGVAVARATFDPSLTDDQKLNLLEEVLSELEKKGGPDLAQHPARQAVAMLLSKMGQFDRATTWWKQLADAAPLNDLALRNLMHCYEQTANWQDAERLMRAQIAFRGEMPGLLFVLGRVLHSAGKMNEAVTALQKSVTLAPEGSDVKRLATELREKALAGGGLPIPPLEVPAEKRVDREGFERALAEFSQHISSNLRMQFWRMIEKKRAWLKDPERFAQNLLHTFLKGKFGENSTIFEEVGAGAGRLDLFVQLSGGLNIVVELKMCGDPYASSYAASGEEQILHYLEHKNTKLGYLVVFDARVNANCESLISARPTGEYTVRETLIDVRPNVPSKAAKARTGRSGRL